MRLVDAFEAERRRIERDLHDGAQQRLVALSMTLGLARLEGPAEPLGGLLAKAQGEADVALVEIRELIRGIHPQVLTDRGLPAAVEDIADRSPIPVDVRLDVPGRLLEAVESGVYFAISEALANVAKHSGATRASVRGGVAFGRLAVEVEDDGQGGARLAADGGEAGAADGGEAGAADGGAGGSTGTVGGARVGTGLQGVADRLSVLGGSLLLSSPPGGPTVFRLEVPCPPARSRT
ncbi:histidine kinase OS=Streptomyces cyaneofuscatus OX=66883 GN=G3I52_18765 PE=4 SV=1 [Streptomyces cyaneofuscatus]